MKIKTICTHILLSFFMILGMMLTIKTDVFAASYNVSVSTKSTKEGGEITVSITGNGCEGSFKVSANNGAKVTGNTVIWTGESTKVKAGSSNFSITVTPKSITDTTDASKITNLRSKTISITVKKPVQKPETNETNKPNNNDGNQTNKPKPNETTDKPKLSSENSLSTLTISQGTLSPSFQSTKTQYDVDLSGNINQVSINAVAKDKKAKVSGTGKKSVSAGDNTFKIVCTAEDGSKKTYTIVFHVDETPLVYTTFNGIQLGVVRNLDSAKIPSGFKKNTVKLDGQDIEGLTNSQLQISLGYLVDEKGNEDFYIIENEKVTSVFQKITINKKSYIVLSVPKESEVRTGMTFSTLEIGKNKIFGWIYDDSQMKDYQLLYLMNAETGEKNYYQYELTEGTLQKYIDFQTEMTPVEKQENDKEESSSHTLEYILFGSTIVFGLLSVGLLVYIQNFKKKSIAVIKNYYEKKNQ